MSSGVQKRLTKMVYDLKRRKLSGALTVALETTEVLSIAIASTGKPTAKAMMDAVTHVGQQLIFASPLDLTIGNVVRRVLFIIREQYEEAEANEQPEEEEAPPPFRRGNSVLVASVSLTDSLYVDLNTKSDGAYTKAMDIKDQVQDAIETYKEELRTMHTDIAKQAMEQIHEHQVVLTFGYSKTVMAFLRAASRKRKFSVVVAVTAPSLEGRRTALELAKEGIDTTLVSDAAVFALMPRINKVILGVRAVLANGGLLTHTGGHVLTLAAKAHHVPVVALSGLYKFTPLYPSEDQDTFQELNPPEQVLPFDEMDRTDGGSVDVVVQNPAFDYVPPELVSLFISNQGPSFPNYIYRVLSEIYHPDDLPELSGPLNILNLQ